MLQPIELKRVSSSHDREKTLVTTNADLDLTLLDGEIYRVDYRDNRNALKPITSNLLPSEFLQVAESFSECLCCGSPGSDYVVYFFDDIVYDRRECLADLYLYAYIALHSVCIFLCLKM